MDRENAFVFFGRTDVSFGFFLNVRQKVVLSKTVYRDLI